MIIPKRFKLDKAAAPKPMPETGMQLDCVHLQEGRFLVSDGRGAAIVPILGTDDRPGADLPRLELDEERHTALLPLQAVKEASKGKVGSGSIRYHGSSTEAQSGPGKQWIRVDNPQVTATIPSFDAAFETVTHDAPETHQYVEVCLDAHLLASISQAIGAEEAVRLRFLVNKETGRADAAGNAHGVVDVRPIRESDGGRGVVMINVVD